MITKFKLSNRILSLVLAFAMVLGMLPMSSFTAFAADGTTNTITDFSVTEFGLSDSWPTEAEVNLDTVSSGEIEDAGKIVWEDGDEILVTLTSEAHGTQTVALIFDAHSLSWAADGYFLYAEGDPPPTSVPSMHPAMSELQTAACS